MQHEKRTIKMAPNEHLRWERQRRGWSRAYIAEQIGVADPKTIGRWERGDAFPSAYFLQRLCTLFQMPAEELGLWQRANQQLVAESTSFYYPQQGHLQFLAETPLYDPELPPAQIEELIGRDRIYDRLKLRLHTNKGPAVASISGLPGAGKTALAVSLAYDNDLQRHFSDGVLWANLGPNADLLGELRRWGNLLGIEESMFLHPESVEEWTRVIHARIGSRALLLIIDDAWTCQEALAFKIGGPNCAYLLTTRIPAVGLYFAGAGAFSLDGLDVNESLEFLSQFVPEIVAQESTEMRELAHLVGGLPLALQLMGTHLQTQVYSGQPRRWRAALEYLKHPIARLQLTMPRPPLERQMGLPADAPISLQNEIELSYRLLDPASRQALIALADLSASTGCFCEEAALAREEVTLEALDNLLDAGLLASSGLGQYTLHQTIADFARCQDELVHDREWMPPQVRVLRQVRGRGAHLAENAELQAFVLEEAMPALAQGSGEAIR